MSCSCWSLGGPALWPATVQIYPDLISGIFLSAALLEVAVVERHHRLTRTGLWVFGFTMAFLPWLHVKNVLLAAVACAGLATVAGRHRLPARPLVVVGAVIAASWVLLFVYNDYYFGHLLGLPQPNPSLTRAGIAQTLGLLFDRQQGLFVQLPTVILGLVGMWLVRRRLPIAVTATGLAAAAALLLNGSYTSVAYGGSAFAGRFQWSVMAILIAWAPLALRRIDRSTTRIEVLAAAIALLWVAQAVPILAGRHDYFSADVPTPPWDPSTYPGWWSGLNVLLPVFTSPTRVLGNPWFALLVGVALAAAAALVTLRLCRRRPISVIPLGSGISLVAVGLIALAVVAPRPLPSHPLSFRGSDIGAPLMAVAQPVTGPAIPLQGIGTGTYTAALDYQLSGSPGAATLTLYCTRGTPTSGSPPDSSVTETLLPGDHTARAELRCPAGVRWAQLAANPQSHLAVTALHISKSSA